jgi:hypothetical protein
MAQPKQFNKIYVWAALEDMCASEKYTNLYSEELGHSS